MNTNTLANNYAQLTPEERFQLILAAIRRGDKVEQERLTNAGKHITFSNIDYSPFAHALQELVLMTYIELLEDAALYHDSYAVAADQRRVNIEAANAPKKKTTTPGTKDQPQAADVVEYPAWHRSGRTLYAVGFLFKVKVEGWKLFCEQVNVAPFALWEAMDLPGIDRFKRAVALAHAGVAFLSAAEMARWLNEVRVDDDRERTETDVVTAQQFAAGLDAAFRERIKWWGGDGVAIRMALQSRADKMRAEWKDPK